jgi:hypothetical protein
MTKKRIGGRLAVTALAVLVAAALFILALSFAPKKIVYPEDDIQFATVTYRGSSMVVDDLKLKTILSKYEARKSTNSYFPYPQDQVEVAIDLARNNRPVHIILGTYNIWYESADKGAYVIPQGQTLKKEILDLIMY